MMREQNYFHETAEPARQILPSQMKMIAYSDEAASWSRNNHLMGTRLPPSSKDSDGNNFSRNRTETMINPITLCPVLLNYAYLSPLHQFFLFLIPNFMSVPQRWLKMLVRLLPESKNINKSLFSNLHYY
jgi:hypothetical protein